MVKQLVKLSVDDLLWVDKNQPHLLHSVSNGIHELQGTFHVDAVFDEGTGEFIVYPTEAEVASANGVHIRDSYSIKIKFIRPTKYEVASVTEIGGRLLRVAERLEVPPADLHIMPYSKLCLHGYYDLDLCLPDGFNFEDFSNNILMPFFYSQSYFEKHGRKWPIGEYSHLELGRRQSFMHRFSFLEMSRYFSGDEKKVNAFLKHTESKSTFREKHKCICKSGKKIRSCSCGFSDLLSHPKFGGFFRRYRKEFPFRVQGKMRFYT